jgi:hypothetical protein
VAELREHTKENDTLGLNEPAEPQDQPQPKDDRDKFLRFDPSSGNQAQKTPQHPVGDAFVPVPSKAAYELLMESNKAKQFFDRELEAKRAWIEAIEENNAKRWN